MILSLPWQANSPEWDGSISCWHSRSQLAGEGSGALGIGVQILICCFIQHSYQWLPTFSYPWVSSVFLPERTSLKFCWSRGEMVVRRMKFRGGIGSEVCKTHWGPSWFQPNIQIDKSTLRHTRTSCSETKAGCTAGQEDSAWHFFRVLAAAGMTVHTTTQELASP